MSDIICIAKRELRKVFKNKETIFEVLISPILAIVLGSLFMLIMTQSAVQQQVNFKADGYVVNAPEVIAESLAELGVVSAEASEVDGIRTAITNGDVDVLVVFPSDFEFTTDPDALHNIEMWYNSSKQDSATAMQHVMLILDSVRPNTFTLNADESIEYDLIEDDSYFTLILGSSYPMWGVMGVLMAVVSFSAYAVAVDKEHGFMNMLLIAPVKRTRLAWGKITASFVLSTISAIAGLIGTIGAVLAYNILDLGGKASFTVGAYAILFVCLLSGSIAMAGVSFFVSTISKTVRQASVRMSMVPVLISFISTALIVPDLLDFVKGIGIVPYLIPIINMNFCLRDFITNSISGIYTLTAVAVNVIVAVVMVLWSASKFNDEKVMQG